MMNRAGLRHSADHATWYVLEDGAVATTFEPHQVGLPDPQRFISVVRSNWGCDLSQPTSGPRTS
jgi:hypothetical protein